MPPKRGQNTGLNQLQQYIYLDMILLSSRFLLASFGPFSESEMLEKDQDAKVFRASVTYGSDGPYITCHTVQAGGHMDQFYILCPQNNCCHISYI